VLSHQINISSDAAELLELLSLFQLIQLLPVDLPAIAALVFLDISDSLPTVLSVHLFDPFLHRFFTFSTDSG
jgi:hypothetical protein